MTTKNSENTDWYKISYRCPTCEAEWEDEWDSPCDSDCPECWERAITALSHEIIPN